VNETPQEPSSDVHVPQADLGWMQSMIEANRQRHFYAAQRTGSAVVVGPSPLPGPEVLLQAAIILAGDRTQEGILVQGVAVAWEEIIRQLAQDPEFLFKIDWRKLEELIAGAYQRDGWSEVILTPRSGDGGRDIIATRTDVGAIRFYDQVKAFNPGHLVTANDVRAMAGVLYRDQNVSKAIVTTTSRFAPGVFDEWKSFTPTRLELKEGAQLIEWLQQIRRQR
jgi:restriction system protein